MIISHLARRGLNPGGIPNVIRHCKIKYKIVLFHIYDTPCKFCIFGTCHLVVQIMWIFQKLLEGSAFPLFFDGDVKAARSINLESDLVKRYIWVSGDFDPLHPPD